VGFYLTGHPLENFKKDINDFINLSFGEDVNEIDFDNLESVIMCGVISELQIRSSKKGNQFVVFKLVDFYGTGECIAFSGLLDSKKECFRKDNLVYVKGRAEENGDTIKLIVEDINPIEKLKENSVTNLMINIYENKTDEKELYLIKDILDRYPGHSNLFFNIINNGSNKVYRSKEYKIKATKELISNLKNIVGENNLRFN
jgi:DNA polymerase-3 subunit alpha